MLKKNPYAKNQSMRILKISFTHSGRGGDKIPQVFEQSLFLLDFIMFNC
jgi:hypothetical protein